MKDFMHRQKTIKLDERSTTLSGDFNDQFLDIIDRKVIIVIASTETARDKVAISVQVGDHLLSAGVIGTATSGYAEDLNTGEEVYYTKYDLTTVPVSKIFWGCDVLGRGETVTIQFLGGTY